MATDTYKNRRQELLTYFDETAADKWETLTTDAPVSGIRATVRAGRDAMRAELLSRLPSDLTGCSILDAGCGTGPMAVDLARRGAHVKAVDLSPRMVDIAIKRKPADLGKGSIDFEAGDMLSEDLGEFDHIVAMDSLIHYGAADLIIILERLSKRTRRTVHFTIAPSTPALSLMHAVGRWFPKGDRAPAIQPITASRLATLIDIRPDMESWHVAEKKRVKSGFYISEALSLRKIG